MVNANKSQHSSFKYQYLETYYVSFTVVSNVFILPKALQHKHSMTLTSKNSSVEDYTIIVTGTFFPFL